MKTRMKWISVGLLIALIGTGLWWWRYRDTISAGARGDRNRPVPALTELVRVGDVPVALMALGTINARQQALVRSRVDGLLQSVHFTEGAMVKAGDSLARIDPRPFAAALAVAQGQLAKDTAQLEAARIDLRRYRKLLAEDSIASQEVDSQESLVKQLEGAIAADQGTVATAQLNVSFTTITAPISGIAGLRQVDPGNMIHASDSGGLVVIAETRPIEVVFSIPQENLPHVLARFQDSDGRKNITVEVYGRDGDTLLEQGRLLAIDNQTDPTTGSIKLKAELANDKGVLFPGQFVNVRLVIETLKDVLTIAQSAVQRGTPGTFVYVVTAEKTASVHKVRLGPSAGGRIVVLEGLAQGETVVIDGADKLRDGAAVTTVEGSQNQPDHTPTQGMGSDQGPSAPKKASPALGGLKERTPDAQGSNGGSKGVEAPAAHPGNRP